jgi:hypothetical protein
MVPKCEPKTIRVWGKIFGIYKDYIIAEGEKDAAAGGEAAGDMEARGATGVNKYVYWVTDSVTGDWTELPNTTPGIIKLSRQIKHIFTGNLDAKIIGNPYFEGTEKDLLRAQIARISHSTTLVQSGIYKIQEDNKAEITEMTEEDKKNPVTFDQLSKLEAWQHYSPNILKCGKCTYPNPQVKEDATEEEKEKARKEMEAADRNEERLKLLSKDSSKKLV